MATSVQITLIICLTILIGNILTVVGGKRAEKGLKLISIERKLEELPSTDGFKKFKASDEYIITVEAGGETVTYYNCKRE